MAGSTKGLNAENAGGIITDKKSGYSREPFNRFKSIDQIDAVKRLEDEQRKGDSPILGALEAYLNRRWNRAEHSKRDVEQQLLIALRQRIGRYELEQQQAIAEQGGTDVFLQLTSVKCQAAEAWVEDILNPQNEKIWSLDPTPIPELNQFQTQAIIDETMMAVNEHYQVSNRPLDASEITAFAENVRKSMRKSMEESAKNGAMNMERLIYDQFSQGGFYDAFRKCVSDLITFKAGFMKGPTLRYEKKLSWRIGANGRLEAVVGRDLRPTFSAPSPFDIYPSPHSTKIGEGYIYEKIRMSRDDLLKCMNVPGFNNKAIEEVLAMYGDDGTREWTVIDQTRAELEEREDSLFYNSGAIECLEFNGSVSGKMLLDWGMKGDLHPSDEYSITAWSVRRKLIMCRINPNPLGLWPYSKASYENIPGSFWGKGVPEKMDDLQGIMNACIRAMVNNLGIASGPQVVIKNVEAIAEGEDITEIFPWKIWQGSDDSNHGGKLVDFFQPDTQALMLLRVAEWIEQRADIHTGIPAYQQGGGEQLGGAARTSSGLSMLMNTSARGIRKIISHVDHGVIKPLVMRMFLHNMMFNDDESIKGDVEIRPRGAIALVVKENTQMRTEAFLAQTLNDIDMGIIGVEGRANVLREHAKNLDIDVDQVVPPKEQLRERLIEEQQMAQQQMQAMAQAEGQGQPQQATPAP